MPNCSRCTRTIITDPHVLTNGNTYCAMCNNFYVRTCHDCDRTFDTSEGYDYNSNSAIVCHTCSLNYFYCDRCDTRLNIAERVAEYCCRSCYTKEENELIKRYNYIPKELKFYGKPPFYMGVELEVETKNDDDDDVENNAKKVAKMLGDFVYLKQDGSLDNGFEIVSHPATLHQHKELWKDFLDKPPRDLISFDSDSCGLHIHASKGHLADITVAKIVVFVNANMNRRFITRLAQRTSEDYAKFKYKTIDNYFSEDKYEAVNLIPKNTIEFRMFKGTLKKESVFRALEFVDAIIHYCSNHPIEKCVSHKDFIDWVKIKKRTYPELNKFCIAFEALPPLTSRQTARLNGNEYVFEDGFDSEQSF